MHYNNHMPDEQQTTPEQQQAPQQPFQPPVEQAPQPSPPTLSPPAAPIAPLPEKKSHKKLWIILGASVFVVLALIVVAVIMFMIAVQKSNTDFTKGNSIDSLKNYSDSGSGVSLKVPAGWDVTKTKPDAKTIVRLTVEPPAGSFSNAFDEQQVIDMVCETTSKSMTEQSFANAVVTGVLPGEEANGLTVSNQSETTIGGLKAYRYEATKQEDTTRTTYYHAYYMAGPTEACDAYILAVTTEAGKKLPIESYVDEILNSFRRSN